MARQNVTSSEQTRSQAVQQQAAEQPVLRPPVDIFETAEGLTLVADMPGVSKERLKVSVERDSLIIEGDVQIELPQQLEPVHADVRATHFRRGFTLSDELDAERISANLKDGVLTLRIPKRAELQPRRIEVQAG